MAFKVLSPIAIHDVAYKKGDFVGQIEHLTAMGLINEGILEEVPDSELTVTKPKLKVVKEPAPRKAPAKKKPAARKPAAKKR